MHATSDFLAVVAELNVRRLRLVLNAIGSMSIGEPNIPADMIQNMLRCRELHKQFIGNNYDVSLNDWHRIKALCNWLVREYDKYLRRTPRTEDVDMPDSTAFGKSPRPRGEYRQLCAGILRGTVNL